MKKIFLSLTISLSLFACNSTKEPEPTIMKMDLKDIQVGGVVHEFLSNEQIEKITKIQKIFAEVYPISLEETIAGFKRDLNIDSEINVWLQMGDAYEKYVNSKKGKLDLNTKKEVYMLILSRSMMNEEEAIKNTQLKILTEKEAKQVLAYYTAEPDPIDAVKMK